NKNTSKKKENGSKQIYSIITFALAILWFCIAIINVEGLWGIIRSFLFGIFGVFNFIYPVLLLVTTVLIALEKANKRTRMKLIQALVILLFISSALGVMQMESTGFHFENYFNEIKFAYEHDGVFGAGALGALIGGIFMLLTGGSHIASLIIIFLILFVLLMLAFNLTLSHLYNGVKKPVKKIGEVTEEKINDYSERIETRFEEKKEQRKDKQKDIDINLGPDPVQSDEPLFIDMIRKENEAKAETEPVDLDAIIKNSVDKNEVKDKSEKKKTVKEPDVKEENDQAEEEQAPYIYPPIDCLALPKSGNTADFESELKSNAEKLVETLRSFNVETRIVDIAHGPAVTRYELQPAAGVKISKITGLADDIALNLAASGVRIEAPIPGKAAVGIEVPNKSRNAVTLREVIDQDEYKNNKSRLMIGLGKDIAGNFVYCDIAKMPHLLVAGTTGSGKSVCLNSMIVSILFNASPDEVKLVMIDPKQVEFNVYNGIPHLIHPVVSDPRKAAGTLGWAVTEMLRRYKLFSESSVRDISGYNSVCEGEGKDKLPQIVIFIDELSDLMMAAPGEVEDSICRLAQMARAAGMHLVIATQSPRVDVITGLIKANIPSRIALSVSSSTDSRVIMDTTGAEKLLGNGDMLYYPVGIAKPIRVQGCFLSEKEVESVVKFIKKQASDVYDEEVKKEIDKQTAALGAGKKSSASSSSGDESNEEKDDMYEAAVEAVVEAQSASTTLLQRKLKLGYARAARIIDQLEENNVIGPYEGSKPRRVLISKQQWYEMSAMQSDEPVQESIQDIDDSDI
ncbi:MAG: DNA translocase FtsK, partial [Clostridiales bacterium]|nr:DNA translocase FtsK [Clostridiales bacterium]